MKRPEEPLHRALVAYLRAALPKPWLCWHTPNGGGRSKAEAGILKAMGTLAGMPDLMLCGPRWPPGTFVPTVLGGQLVPASLLEDLPRLIAIELKAPPPMLASGKRSKAQPKLSPAQRDVIAALAACGVPTIVASDIDDAVSQLRALGVPLKGRVM